MVYLTTGLEDPVSPCFMSPPIRVREARLGKVVWLWVRKHTLHTSSMRG